MKTFIFFIIVFLSHIQRRKEKESKHYVLFVCLFGLTLVAAPPNKKRAWSWPAYLEEEKAIAAPVKLYKEVKY